MEKKSSLKEVLKLCKKKVGHGSSANWKHSDFYKLHIDIFKHTNVNLSPNTLKRIFGKIPTSDNYLPQQATIDALEKYGKYYSDVKQEVDENNGNNNYKSIIHFRKNFKSKYWLYLGVGILVLGSVMGIILNPEGAQSKE